PDDLEDGAGGRAALGAGGTDEDVSRGRYSGPHQRSAGATRSGTVTRPGGPSHDSRAQAGFGSGGVFTGRGAGAGGPGDQGGRVRRTRSPAVGRSAGRGRAGRRAAG